MIKDEFIKVLLVEDNPGDIRLVQLWFDDPKADYFQLEFRYNLTEGLNFLESETADLILLDLTLPDSAGLETFEKVHSDFPLVPIIVLSGVDDEDIAVEAVRRGAQDYLVKNQVESGLVIRAIKYAMERQRLMQALEEKSTFATKRQWTPAICPTCKETLKDRDFWNHLEQYISDHAKASASTGVCSPCYEETLKGKLKEFHTNRTQQSIH